MENRRKTIVVDKHEQVKMAITLSWPILLALSGLALIFGISLGNVAAQSAIADPDSPSVVPIIVSTAALSVISVALVAWMTLRATHRIAGPNYRMRKTIAAFLAGDSSVRVQLRRGDHLQDLANGINSLLDHMAELGAVKSEAAETGEKFAEADAPVPATMAVSPDRQPNEEPTS